MENNWNQYWFDFIFKHEHNMFFISSNPNVTLELIEKYPNKLWKWKTMGSNPNLTLEWIEKYPDKPWHWGKYTISKNPNVTLEWIEKFPDKDWYWEMVV